MIALFVVQERSHAWHQSAQWDHHPQGRARDQPPLQYNHLQVNVS